MNKAGETSMDMLKLATGIIFFSAILILVIKSVSIGNGIFQTNYNNIQDIEVKAEKSNLADLKDTTTILPGGSVYALLTYNQKSIGEITSYLNYDMGKKYVAGDNLIKMLKGDIYITVILNINTGLYDIVLKQ